MPRLGYKNSIERVLQVSEKSVSTNSFEIMGLRTFGTSFQDPSIIRISSYHVDNAISNRSQNNEGTTLERRDNTND